MSTLSKLLAGCAILAVSATAAFADCAADLARFEADHAEGIAKDGSLAPLQTEADAGAAGADAPEGGFEAASADPGAEGAQATGAGADAVAADAEESIAKDGTLAPLETAEGDPAGVATSAQDAQAQQAGEPTAAEQATTTAEAGDAGQDGARDAAMERARDALAAGDEAGCAAALDEARAS